MSPHQDDQLLQRYAEGLVDDDRRAAIERHLAECPECAAVVDGYSALFSDLNRVPVVQAPTAMAGAVMAAYDKATEPIPALWSDRKLLVAFALFNAMLVLIIGGVVGLSGPVDLVSTWALSLKDLALTAMSLFPAVEAIWTAMAHGGMAVVLALALMLVGTVAALRRTMRTVEETP